mmetsp:Transcript_4998/g.7136  ORF Transcript_4998/g.7136 Transcript_4998/m.7136 type:complete len:134 (-) Transcript_4998:81-482(-)
MENNNNYQKTLKSQLQLERDTNTQLKQAIIESNNNGINKQSMPIITTQQQTGSPKQKPISFLSQKTKREIMIAAAMGGMSVLVASAVWLLPQRIASVTKLGALQQFLVAGLGKTFRLFKKLLRVFLRNNTDNP